MAEEGQPSAPKTRPTSPPEEQSDRPYVPTLAVTSPRNYGNIDAENESNLQILSSVESPKPAGTRLGESSARRGYTNLRKRAYSSGENSMHEDSSHSDVASHRHGPALDSEACPLFKLPPELVHEILEYLEPFQLALTSATCRFLREHAISEVHWQRLVQENVPGTVLTTPGPVASFRELYALHSRLWFLPKYRLWFSNLELTGRLIIARFDPARACIEAYQAVVAPQSKTYQAWESDSRVVIHSFEATAGLHTTRPVLQFLPEDANDLCEESSTNKLHPWLDEIPIPLDDRSDGIHNSLSLTRPLDDDVIQESMAASFPYHQIWPPPIIPARDYIKSYPFDLPMESRPRRREEVSDQTFRIRRWMEMSGAIGVRLGEDVAAYATLNPELYTPTKTRPWRGIWVGDYSGHGFEFLLIHQPDAPPATDAELDLVQSEDESEEDWKQRRLEARIFRGRLEAIKLTGDPNVPRGEYTFVADDLGPDGYVGLVHDDVLMGDDPRGTRVVRSKGHVALTGFVEDMFIESQLMLISPNKLAQYWVEFGHISYFQRVDIDGLLSA